jgi:hypothetical protein
VRCEEGSGGVQCGVGGFKGYSHSWAWTEKGLGEKGDALWMPCMDLASLHFVLRRGYSHGVNEGQTDDTVHDCF